MSNPGPGDKRVRSRGRNRSEVPRPPEESQTAFTDPGRPLTPVSPLRELRISGNGNGSSPENGGNGDGGPARGNGNGEGQPPRNANGGRDNVRDERDPLARYDYQHTKPEGSIKKGAAGFAKQFLSNYYPVNHSTHEFILYHYNVKIDPEVDHIGLRRRILYSIDAANLTRSYICDGKSLWTRVLICPIGESKEFTGAVDQVSYKIRLTCVAQLPPGDPRHLQVYNVIVRKCLRILQLTLMGRNYFDHNVPIDVQTHRLTLWPGFVTTLRRHDGGLLYCVELTHKVIRTDTIWQHFSQVRQRMMGCPGGMDAVKNQLFQDIVGTVVMSDYNRKTYRIDDISWAENPESTFDRNGSQVSYVDYFKEKWGLSISNLKQPLLISRPKDRDVRAGRTTDTEIKLIPELCRMTGLSEGMRQNFTLMKDLSKFLFQTPVEKVASANAFIKRLMADRNVQEHLGARGWDMQVSQHPMWVPGRILPPEAIHFKNAQGNHLQHQINPNDKADFTTAFKGGPNRVISADPMTNWVITFPTQSKSNVDNLISTLQKVASGIGFRIGEPKEKIAIANAQPHAYIKAINDIMNTYRDLQLIFTVLPNNKLELYSAVKKRCYGDFGISSQCFLQKNLTSKGLMSIATKCAIQVCAKLGGEPWGIKVPMTGAMVLGFDVYHGVGDGQSVGAMCATTSRSWGNYFSCVNFFRSREELSANMASDMERCLKGYYLANNRELPDRIFFYRDGVGEGQVHFVYTTELQALKATAAECANAFEEEEDENIEYLRDVVDSPFSTIMDYNQNVPGFDSPMTNISTFVALDPADHDHHEENANQNVTSSSSSGAAPRIKIEEVDVDDDDNREDLNTESEEAMPSSSGANSEEMNRSDSNDNAAADIEADDMDMDDNTPDANGQEETEVKKIEDALCYSQLIAQVCQNQNGLRACLPNLQSIFRALQRSHYRMIFGTSESYKDPTPVVPIVVDDDQDD